MATDVNDIVVNAIKPIDPYYLADLISSSGLTGYEPGYAGEATDYLNSPYGPNYVAPTAGATDYTTSQGLKDLGTVAGFLSNLPGAVGNALYSLFTDKQTKTDTALGALKNLYQGVTSSGGEIVVNGTPTGVSTTDFSKYADYLNPNYVQGLLGNYTDPNVISDGTISVPGSTTEDIVVSGTKPSGSLYGTTDLTPLLPNYVDWLDNFAGVNKDEIVSTAQKPTTPPNTDGTEEIVSTGIKPIEPITVPGIQLPGANINVPGGVVETGTSGGGGLTITDVTSIVNGILGGGGGATALRQPRALPNYTVTPYAGDYEKYGFGAAHNFYSPEYYGIVPQAAQPTATPAPTGTQSLI